MPLEAHPAFRSRHIDQLTGILETQLGAKIARLPRREVRLQACANRFKLPLGELWFCSYGTPLSVRFPETDHVRIQIQHAGIGATWVNKQMIAVTPTQACISQGATEIDFSADFQQIVWRVPRGALVQKLAAIYGGPVTSDFDFNPVLDLSQPKAATMKHVMGCMVHAIDTIAGEPGKIVFGELEQAFTTAFLVAAAHKHSDKLAGPVRPAAPWQVKRAESYIEGHWEQPITIDELVAVTGVSARTLFRTFRESRNCSPLEFARRVRLENARHMLQVDDGDTSVTKVAFACGFGDLSRFSKDFASAFGEAPSAVMKRSREQERVA